MKRAPDAAPLPALKHLLLGDSAKSSTACVSGPQSSLDIQRSFHGLEMVHIALNCLFEGLWSRNRYGKNQCKSEVVDNPLQNCQSQCKTQESGSF